MRVRLIIEYDGTNYSGWQRQMNSNSIQQEIEKAIWKLTGREITIHGAGRTDAGVHALGQVFHFDTDDLIPADRYANALNTKMPFDIRALSSMQVEDDFHSRFDATGKHYRYTILNRPRPTALYRHRAWHVVKPLDIDRMKRGAAHLLGEHDFSTFMAARSDIERTVRTLYSLDIENKGEFITFDVKGDGFLRNMVRIMVGTLAHMGMGKLYPGKMPQIIKACDRHAAGVTAPAAGLCLVEVYYHHEEKGAHQ